MDAIPSNLCTLVEQLEDSRQFHHAAAQQSTGDRRERHHERSLTYAAMLSEITAWESRNSAPVTSQHVGATDGPRDTHLDGYAALLERVYRIHKDTASVVHAIHARAIGHAMDGGATDGRRRAGESVRC